MSVALTALIMTALLGLPLMGAALLGSGLEVGHRELSRWCSAALPLAGFAVFLLSALQRQPWLAGLAGTVVAGIAPHMTLSVRLAVFLGVTLTAGVVELLMHRGGKLRRTVDTIEALEQRRKR